MKKYEYEENLFIEIADISKFDGYIRFPAFSDEDLNEQEVVLPLCSYYYSCLRLCLANISERFLKSYNDAIELIEKLWCISNKSNISIIQR